MLISIDKESLNAEQRATPYRTGLIELVEQIGRVNPLFNFVCDKDCVGREWDRDAKKADGSTGDYVHTTHKVKVFQDGEQLGAIGVSNRYRRSVGCELVFGIESFRIQKDRGRGDTTYTKDLKVALRTAKKVFVARASNEMYSHIFNNVKEKLNNLWGSTRNTVRYSLDVSEESLTYAKAAYLAHKQGKTTVELPVRPASVRDYDSYITKCDELDCVTKLWELFQAKEGYVTKVLEDGKIISVNLADGVITKYDNTDAMPTEMANKFVMFKVLKVLEPYEHLGVMFEDNFYFVVK